MKKLIMCLFAGAAGAALCSTGVTSSPCSVYGDPESSLQWKTAMSGVPQQDPTANQWWNGSPQVEPVLHMTKVSEYHWNSVTMGGNEEDFSVACRQSRASPSNGSNRGNGFRLAVVRR